MTKSEFLQMVEMDRAKKSSGMQNINREDIQRIQQMISPQRPVGMLQNVARTFGNALQDIGVAVGRSSADPGIQAVGHSYRTSGEQADYNKKEASEILNFLQKQEEARVMQEHKKEEMEMHNRQIMGNLDYNNRYLTETSRHNLATEGRESAQDRKYAREEEKEWKAEMRNKELSEEEPGAFYLDTVPVSERNKYIAEQQKFIQGSKARKEVTRISKKLYNLVKDNPIISKYSTSLFNDDKGGVLGHLNMMRLSNEDRTVLNTFKKYRSDLVRLKVEAMAGSTRPNMFLDKVVSSSVGDAGMTRSALLELFKNGYLESESFEKADNKVKKDKSRRIFNQLNLDHEYEGQSGGSEPSLKEIQEAIARKKGMMQ